jgi:tRNA-modifying protein YgfZ
VDGPHLEDEIVALDEGRGAVAASAFRAVVVTGSDAAAWLNDLLTAEVERLAPGEAVRSLLLTPTGRIRADLHVLRLGDERVLLQCPDQPVPIEQLLAPYVLSSDVELRGTTEDPDLLAVPGVDGWRFVSPADSGEMLQVSAAALESWRIRRGIARFPVDLGQDSLPSEAGLDDGVVIDRTKGCYLGQESVAKVRNLGHPAHVVLALRAAGAVDRGERVVAEQALAGIVTSADAHRGGTDVLARIRWADRAARLRTASGSALEGR